MSDLNYTEEELRANCSPEVAALNRDKLGITNNGPGAPGSCEATVRRKRGEATDKAAPSMRESEADFESWVVDLAHVRGWKVAGFRPARLEKRTRLNKKTGQVEEYTPWRTAVKYDGVGFPDLVLLRRHTLIFVEVKSENGSATPEQSQWLADLHNVSLWVNGEGLPWVRSYLWRPSDRPEIERILG